MFPVYIITGKMLEFFSYERMDWLWRVLLAQTVIWLFVLFNFVSISLQFVEPFRPYFILVAIYYWSIYRPTLMPPHIVFCIGMIFDVVMGFPLGIHSIIFLLVQWAIKNQRSFFMGQPYLVVWMGFALTISVVLCAEWLFFGLINGSLAIVNALLVNFFFTALLFHLIVLIFVGVHRILPIETKSYF